MSGVKTKVQHHAVMHLITWNINGVRSIKPSFTSCLKELDAEIVCLQETKITRDLTTEDIAILQNFTSYYSFCGIKSGYSGVATYCHDAYKPVAAEEGLSGVLYDRGNRERQDLVGMHGDYSSHFTQEQLTHLDREGRAIVTKHRIRSMMDTEAACDYITIINVYCPRADADNEERFEYKMNFYKLLQLRAESLAANNCHVIIVGDFNVSHMPIDHCDPGDPREFESSLSRQWMSQFLKNRDGCESCGSACECASRREFVDAFRHFHPAEREAFTCWRTDTGARSTNYGTRIDYIVASAELVGSAFTSCHIRPHVTGSDHCPVAAHIQVTPLASHTAPAIATCHWPEFAGKQQKLTTFFNKGSGIAGNDNKRSAAPDSDLPNRTKKLRKSKQTMLSSFFVQTNKTIVISKESGDSVVEDVHTTAAASDTTSEQVTEWRSLLRGLPRAPLCKGHGEPCLLRTVKKPGNNFGKKFYVCNKPEGRKDNPLANCQHFEWFKPVIKKYS